MSPALDALAAGMRLDGPLPAMARVRQEFDATDVADVPAAVGAAIGTVTDRVRPGMSIAVAVGSRGIDRIGEVVIAVVGGLRAAGADPYIVTAMGSHGGATADGQRAVLAGYGITEETTGVPVRAGMESVEVGRMPDGTRLWTDAEAAKADGIVVVGRIKPHTDFKGPVESGLTKMLVIGLGNRRGAETIHQLGMRNFPEVIPRIGRAMLDRLPVLFGVGLVENAYDRICHVEAVAADRILEREPALLDLAKDRMGSILLDRLHLLVIDQLGKDVSGAGMDSNITGRPPLGTPGFPVPPAERIAVLGLTERTHGNATGIGMADVITARALAAIDVDATWINGVTSRVPEGSRIPLVAASEADAVRIGLASAVLGPDEPPRVVRIATTLALEEIEVSPACLAEVEDHPRLTLLSEPAAWR